MGGLSRLPWRAIDVGVAGAFTVAYLIAALTTDHRGPTWAAVLAALGVSVPLAWRRRHPLPVAVAVSAAVILSAAVTVPNEVSISPLLPLMIVAYSVGAHEERRRSWRLGLPVTVLATMGVASAAGAPVWSDYLFPPLFVAIAWGGGRLVRSRTELAAQLHEEAVRAEDERERHAELAVAEERRRIARELHDVVAHSMSVMVVQAGGARRIGARDPERAAAAAEQIERTGREALAEMRRLLGVLRVDGAEAPLAPQPGMEQLPTLVERARDAGLPIELTVEGGRRALPAGVDLTGYRIVQEALTNTMKHARSAPTEVRVRYGEDALELVVANAASSATDAPEAALASGGHGIVGMRERVRVVGGELHAGPRPGGGFDVRARLPLIRQGVGA